MFHRGGTETAEKNIFPKLRALRVSAVELKSN